MIRLFIENALLFFLPTMIYVAWILATRVPEDSNASVSERAKDAYQTAPLIWLLLIGGLLVLATLILFAQTDPGGRPDQVYRPAEIRDGKLIPGGFE